MRKPSGKSNKGTLYKPLTNNILEIVKAIKNKGSLSKCDSREEQKVTGNYYVLWEPG